MRRQTLTRVVSCLSTAGVVVIGCSTSDDTQSGNSTGGNLAAAGSGGTSGSPASTGGTPTGGKAATPTGGTPATPTGGVAGGGSGGAGPGTGGASPKGGSTGGTTPSGGMAGATGGSAGSVATGGVAGGSGGSAGSSTAGSSGKGLAGDPTKSAGCGKTGGPTSKTGYTIDIGGKSRTYHLKLPDNYDPNTPHRLILSYHWLGGTANEVHNGGTGTVPTPYYGLFNLSEGSSIFAAPQGIDNSWPNDPNNIEFARALITRLTSELCIDEKRIFSQGFSMGGSMSYALACALGGTVRAVAVYGGGPMSGCVAHDKPVGYLMVHGTNDSVCKYPGYGVPQIEDFASVNGCMDMSMPTPTSQNMGTCVDYKGCDAGFPARACLHTGDHTPAPGGKSTWVPAEAWKFFSQF